MFVISEQVVVKSVYKALVIDLKAVNDSSSHKKSVSAELWLITRTCICRNVENVILYLTFYLYMFASYASENCLTTLNYGIIMYFLMIQPLSLEFAV